jgi:hypothetical protein
MAPGACLAWVPRVWAMRPRSGSCLLATAVPLLMGTHGAATLSSALAASSYGGGCLNLLRRRRVADDEVGTYSSALKNKCLKIVGSGGIRWCAPMFFSDRLISEGTLQSSAGS